MRIVPKLVVSALAAAILASPAFAAEPASSPEAFSAMEGIQAEALTPAEMDAIHGALTGQDLYNALVARATLIRDPVLRQKTLDYLAANQTRLVAYFDRLLSFFRR